MHGEGWRGCLHPRVASRRRRCVTLCCPALRCAAQRCVASRRRLTNVSLPRAPTVPFHPLSSMRRRNATRECVYSSPLLSAHPLVTTVSRGHVDSRGNIRAVPLVVVNSPSFSHPQLSRHSPFTLVGLSLSLSPSLSLYLLPPDCFPHSLSFFLSRYLSAPSFFLLFSCTSNATCFPRPFSCNDRRTERAGRERG